MKQVRQPRFGDPAGVLELIDADPYPVRDGFVAVAVEATPIHNGDLMNIIGVARFRPSSLPWVPGIEGVGRVTEVGLGVDGLSPGDRVVFLCSAHSDRIGRHYTDAWQERVCIPADHAYPAPEGDAAQFANIINAVSADVLLQAIIELEEGEWVLQNGANSNVGRYLIRLANRRAYRTINVVRRAASVAGLEGLGADAVVTDGADLAARVAAATGGAPIRLGIDCVAGDATTRIAECLVEGGTVVNYGLMSGEPCRMAYTQLVQRNIMLRGKIGFVPHSSPEEKRKIISDLVGLMADGTLVAKIAEAYALEDFREAVVHAAKSGEVCDGKVIFRMFPQPENYGGRSAIRPVTY